MAENDKLRDQIWNKMTNDDVIRENLLLLVKISKHTERSKTVLNHFLFYLQGSLVIGLIYYVFGILKL